MQQIKDLNSLGTFVRESTFNEKEGLGVFRERFFERFEHLSPLKKKPIVMYLENGNPHMVPAISYLEKLFHRLQAASWYKEVSNTTEGDNFKYLVLAAIAATMHEDIHKQINFVGGFMNKEFEVLSDLDINLVDFILESHTYLDNIYVPWDGYTNIEGTENGIPTDPMDYLYNMLNTLTHKYFIGENKMIMHDIYRFALCRNLVCYHETGNNFYRDMAYKNQIAGLYINISSISV